MDWEDENADSSVTGSILRAAGTGMLIVCMAFVGKAIFGGTTLAVDHLVTAALAGAFGTAAMLGAAAADCECRKPEDEDVAEAHRVAEVESIGSRGLSAEVDSSEQFQGRFTAKLERQRGRWPGRGM